MCMYVCVVLNDMCFFYWKCVYPYHHQLLKFFHLIAFPHALLWWKLRNPSSISKEFNHECSYWDEMNFCLLNIEYNFIPPYPSRVHKWLSVSNLLRCLNKLRAKIITHYRLLHRYYRIMVFCSGNNYIKAYHYLSRNSDYALNRRGTLISLLFNALLIPLLVSWFKFFSAGLSRWFKQLQC